MVVDIEALAREVYESSKLKVKADEKVTTDLKKAIEYRGGSCLLDRCRVMMRLVQRPVLVQPYHDGRRCGISHLLNLR